MRETVERRGGSAAVVVVVVAGVVASLLTVVAIASAATPRFDQTPELTWGTNGIGRAVEILADQIWVGGDFDVARGPGESPVVDRSNLAVFDLNDGTLRDISVDTNDRVRAIESNERTVWVGGNFTSVRGLARDRLFAIDAITGVVLDDFAPSANDDVHAVLYHDGWLYVGGEFTTINGLPAVRLVRMNPQTGVVDPNFRPQPNEEVRALAAYGDRLYVVGEFTDIGPPGQVERHVYAAGVSIGTGARVGPIFPLVERNGPDDHAFRVGADVVQVSADGEFVFIGDRSNEITKWNRLGGQEIWDRTSNGDIQAMAIDDGSIYLGTHEGWDFDLDERLLVAIDEFSGATDQVFAPRLDSFWGVRGLAVAEQGLVAVGEFQDIDGVGAERLAIFRPEGGFSPAPSLESLFPSPEAPGDADCDGSVTAEDVRAILRFRTGQVDAVMTCDLAVEAQPAAISIAGGDIDSGGSVDLLDALLVAQCLDLENGCDQ